MRSLSVGGQCQGGKICESVSYTIYEVARRLTHRCDPCDEASAAALVDSGVYARNNVGRRLPQKFEHFHETRFNHVGELGAFVDPLRRRRLVDAVQRPRAVLGL